MNSGQIPEGGAPTTLDELLAWIGTLAPPWSKALRLVWRTALAITPALEPGEITQVESRLAELTELPLRAVIQTRLDEQNRDESGVVLHTSERVAKAFVEELKKECTAAVWSDGSLYVYEAENGSFLKIARAELQMDVAEFVSGKPVASRLRDVAEITDRVCDSLREEGYFDDAAAGINFANGFAKWDSETNGLVLVEHSFHHKARFTLPVDYAEGAAAPTFLAGMERLFPHPAMQQAAQEMFAATLFRLSPSKDRGRNMHILKGVPGSGKSTILEVLEMFFPDDVKASVSPASFGKPYSLVRLAGKLLNTCTELPLKLPAAERIKQVVVREVVSARNPHEREFQFRCMARHIFACNQMPTIADQTNAFARRVLVITTERSLDRAEVDGNFLEKVRREMAGIVAWAAEGAAVLMRNQAFTLPPGHEEALAELQYGSDLVAKFVGTQMMAAPGGRLTSAAIQERLQLYFEVRGQGVPSMSGAMGRVASLVEKLYGGCRAQTNNKPFYEGVGWRTGTEGAPPPLTGGGGDPGNVPGGAAEVGHDSSTDVDMEDL